MLNFLDALLGARPRAVVLAWLLVALVAVPGSMVVARHLTAGGYEVPGSASARVQATVGTEFPELGAEQFVVVLDAGRAGDRARLGAALSDVRDRLRPFAPQMSTAPADLARAEAAVASGAELVPLVLTTRLTWSAAIDRAPALQEALRVGETRSGVTTYLAGRGAQASALQAESKSSLQMAETIGFPVLLALLFAIFGSLLAALMPLILAGVALLITGAVLYGLTRLTDVSVFSQNMASMIGVGVAVDYALFVLVRFREELGAGASVEDARRTSMRTSGAAVVTSGLTVALSLGCVLIVGNGALRSMAAGAIIVVLVAVAATVTLLPALMTMLGTRLARHRFARPAVSDDATPFWRRWTAIVMRRPALTAGAAALGLLALCSPVLSLRAGDDTLRQLPSDDDTRVAAQLAGRSLGAGGDAPLAITLRWSPSSTEEQRQVLVGRLGTVLRADRAIRTVSPAVAGRSGRVSIVLATADVGYETSAGRAVVERVRTAASDVAAGSVATVDVGGAGASGVDLIHLVTSKLPLLILLIVLSAYLVLVLTLRTVVLPVKAVLTNLLSVGAGLGAVVALFQWGWLGGLTGIEPIGHVQAMALPLILAVVFGLSMDYQVFLLARIRERWLATRDNAAAVADGLSSTAGVITGAALIMVAVFVSFAATGVPIVQQLGVGCAVAIAVDATIVRLVLVPATMALLGDLNWWWPGGSRNQAGAPEADHDLDASGSATVADDEPSADEQPEPAGSLA